MLMLLVDNRQSGSPVFRLELGCVQSAAFDVWRWRQWARGGLGRRNDRQRRGTHRTQQTTHSRSRRRRLVSLRTFSLTSSWPFLTLPPTSFLTWPWRIERVTLCVVWPFYPNVTTLRLGLCYRKPVCRLSIVCNVRAPYTPGLKLSPIFLHHFVA